MFFNYFFWNLSVAVVPIFQYEVMDEGIASFAVVNQVSLFGKFTDYLQGKLGLLYVYNLTQQGKYVVELNTKIEVDLVKRDKYILSFMTGYIMAFNSIVPDTFKTLDNTIYISFRLRL